ncbi:MAG TPA: LpqB family beta-propeller domain-containing protein [Gemmatimonadales bacterium]|nr:LpqB family beta-propeller domain-containing protein [Gemmatimonadales bacterium]
MTSRGFFATVAGVLLSVPALAAAQNVAEVQVAPPSINIRVGERTGLLATAFDRIGNVIPTVRIIWSSNNINIARVDNNGTVTGVGNGVALIEARVGSRRGQATVQVTGGAGAPAPAPPPGGAPPGPPAPPPPPPPPAFNPLAGQPAGSGPAAALRLEPGVVYLLPSENTRVSPRALRDDGSPAAPVLVTWTSLRPDVASVDQSGNVVALSPGQGTIQATAAGGLTATAPVVVQQADFSVQEGAQIALSPGEVDTLHVIVANQSNRTVNPLVLQWSSNDQSVARVSLAGVVTAAGPGKTTLTVSGLLQSKTVEVSVHQVVDKLSVRPRLSAEVQVPLTGTARFEAQALTADNAPVPEAPLRWSVADPAIASFDPQTGILTGRSVGKTQLTVRGPSSGLAVSWNVAVIAGAPRFTQPRVGLGLNERHTLRANYTDDQGNILGPAGNLTWTSDNQQVATVGEDGTVAGTGYGHARITASAPGGKSTTADVYVVGEIIVASSRAGPGKFQLYSVERSNLAQFTKLSSDTASASEPAFSPDGSRIAFVSQRDGNAEIYVMNADGTGTTRVTNDPLTDGSPAFAPDGQSIVFHSSRTAGKQQIWAVNIDGTGLTQLTKDSVNSSPSVSPDGQTIAYVSTRNKDGDIWLMGKDGSNQRQFTRSPQQRESEPRFLRDGTLAYLVERREGNRTVQQVMRADLATGSVTALTGTDLAIASFAVSPAGDLVALVVNADPGNRRNPTYKVYIQPVSSAMPVPLPTTGAEQMITPAFRP